MTLLLLIPITVTVLACIHLMSGGVRINKWLLRALGGLFVLLLVLFGEVAFTQYQAGCPSLLGDCYNANLPEGWSFNKLIAPVFLFCWLALALGVILICAMRILWRIYRRRTTVNLSLRQPLPPE